MQGKEAEQETKKEPAMTTDATMTETALTANDIETAAQLRRPLTQLQRLALEALIEGALTVADVAEYSGASWTSAGGALLGLQRKGIARRFRTKGTGDLASRCSGGNWYLACLLGADEADAA